MKRFAYILMSYDVVLSVAASRPLASVDSTLPADASVAWIELLQDSRSLRVYFESEANAPVPEGQIIPQFSPSLTTHFPDPVPA